MRQDKVLMKRILGVTLIEIIIVIFIMGILFAGTARFFDVSYTLYHTQKNIINDSAQGQLATQMMKKDIELIRSTGDITRADNNRLTFTNMYGDSVDYRLRGGRVRRNNQRLVENAQSLAFQYYNSSGALLSFPVNVNDIRYIDYAIVVNNSTTFTFSGGAALWNIL